MKALDFDTITIMVMKDDEGANNKKHVDDCISKLEIKSSSENTTSNEVNLFNLHI